MQDESWQSYEAAISRGELGCGAQVRAHLICQGAILPLCSQLSAHGERAGVACQPCRHGPLSMTLSRPVRSLNLALAHRGCKGCWHVEPLCAAAYPALVSCA